MASVRGGSAGWPVPAPALVLVLVLALGLAGCGATSDPSGYPEPPQPRAKVSAVEARLMVALPGEDGVFATSARAKAAAFLDSYRDGGRGPLNITIVSDSGRVASITEALRLLARRRGVVEDDVVISTTTTGKDGITLRYTDHIAVPPACNPETVLGRNPAAEVSPNLGCALEGGIAAMIAHPANLLGPVIETAADGVSRGRVVELHRQGKATGAEATRNEDAKAASVSNVAVK